ncbi:MAG TPA: hypothetical protein ENK32_11390 [Anaerolineae bacterium]|nr:hypothetical protein [Anaerolineae bacterium]
MPLPEKRPRLARGLKLAFLLALTFLFLELARLAAAQSAPPAAPLDNDAFIRTAVPIQMVARLSQSGVRLNGKTLDERASWGLVPAIYNAYTTPARLASGMALYQYACAQCHGANGVGADPALPDLSSLGYWGSRSNQNVYDALMGDTAVSAHTFTLEPDQTWLLIEAMRQFSYAEMTRLSRPVPAKGQNVYKPARQTEPDNAVTITGIVQNGTTNGRLREEIPVTLRAYNGSYTIAQTYTTTLSADGAFTFTLEETPDDWVYMVTLTYKGQDFSSDVGQLDTANPQLSLPVTVYEPASDPAAIRISRLHVSLTFLGDQLRVSELYNFANDSAAVFVGTNGRADEGTIQISLPQGAADPAFERGLGQDRFFPANEFFQKGDSWYDTLPLRPGASSQTILVTYSLPYAAGMTLNHDLAYPADELFLALADRGVTLTGGEWTQQESRSAGENGVILTYTQSGLDAGSRLTIPLQGDLRLNGRSASQPDNQTGQWIIAAGVFLFGLYLLWRMIRQRRKKNALPANLS